MSSILIASPLFLLISLVSGQVIKPIAKPIISFSAGESHACAVFNSKQIKCWGKNYSWGQHVASNPGTGDSSNEIGVGLPFVNFGTNAKITKVSCGFVHTCVRLESGEMKCMGHNASGQTGIGSSSVYVGYGSGYYGDTLPAVNLGANVKVLDIALGSGYSCAIVTGGKVKCFGYNTYGELGLGDTKERGKSSSDLGDALPYTEIGTNTIATSIHSSATAEHTCVILSMPIASAQRIKCWGMNFFNELGYGDQIYRGDNPNEMGDKLPLVDLGTESRVKQLGLADEYSCALLVNDKLKCWGKGNFGNLGSGSTATITSVGNALPYVQTDSGKTIISLSVGYFHTCIVFNDQLSVKCVGINKNGQLGQGDTVNRGAAQPTLFLNIPNIKLGTGTLKIGAVYGGYDFNCVVFEDSSVKCFGGNQYGQLAIGNNITIGDAAIEMGTNLKYATLFSSTKAPTNVPTRKPTKVPTRSPTRLCVYPTATKCNKDLRCIWKKVGGKSTCVEFSCSNLTTAALCLKQKTRCAWSSSDEECYSKFL